VQAPTAGSVILASVMLKMGAYGFLRFSLPMLTEASIDFTPMVLTLSVVAIIYGAYMALAQSDIKKLIAYSSVSHMGFVMIGMFVYNQQGIEGAILQMLNHGITTGALFLCVGVLYDRRHTRDIGEFGGLAQTMPMYATCFMIFTLSSIGLPGTNGFVGEFLVLLGSFRTHPWATGLATTGVIFAAVYLLWALQRIIYQKIVHPENETLPDLSRRELAILVPLVAMILWMGVYPRPFLSRIERSVEAFVTQVGPAAGVAPAAAETAGIPGVTHAD
jgi:NADH-quinone oxidoreductase subunit M